MPLRRKILRQLPGLADPDTDLGSPATQHDTQRNRGNVKSSKKSNQSVNLPSKSNEPQTGRSMNAQTKRPVTVVAGDSSIIQNIRGWNLSKTIEDMEDVIKPILRKELDNIIIHVGTNDVSSQ